MADRRARPICSRLLVQGTVDRDMIDERARARSRTKVSEGRLDVAFGACLEDMDRLSARVRAPAACTAFASGPRRAGDWSG